MRLLIPGGAGYIGSHMVRCAIKSGHEVTVLDDFSSGHHSLIEGVEVLEVNLLDKNLLSRALKNRKYDGVIHFAAKSLVAESIANPSLYYSNNVVGTLNLLNVMLNNNINNIVFSSTAAVYGTPNTNKINELHRKKPINPYGSSKLMVETILENYSKAYNLNAISFRYFNAAGADSKGDIGEKHEPETHLIPIILDSMINNTKFRIFGNDYPTNDGTCIRDYIHVNDIASSHLLGLTKIIKDGGYKVYNLGNENGFSIYELIKKIENITKITANYEVDSRRPGDPHTLVADSSKAKLDLGWKASNSSLENIIKTAWNWHNNKN